MGMTLSDWLASTSRTDSSLARELGCAASTVSRLRRGLVRPSNMLAARIQALSSHKVTAVDHEAAFVRRIFTGRDK